MRLIMFAAVAGLAISLPLLAQSQGGPSDPQMQSQPSNTVGSGTGTSLDSHKTTQSGSTATMVRPGHRGAVRAPGSMPKDGVNKPEGTTGAPPYGATPNSGAGNGSGNSGPDRQ